jgi:hypothetical protein
MGLAALQAPLTVVFSIILLSVMLVAMFKNG